MASKKCNQKQIVMKKIFLLMTGMLLMGLMQVNAQKKVVRVYPKHGTVVTTIHKPKVIVHTGKKYHFSKGVWYRFNKGRYIVTAAPLGIGIKRLPRGHKVVVLGGKKFYTYKGVRYQKRGRVFVVV